MLSPLVLLLAIFLVQSFVPPWISLVIFFLFVIEFLVGFVFFMYFVLGSKLFFHSLDLMRKTSPDELILRGRYAVAKKGSVFLVAYWGSNALFFIAFFQTFPAEQLKLRIPRTIWRWEYTVSIGEVKVARRLGEYTVPDSEDDFITGEGILYSLLIESMPPFETLQYPSRDQLLQIASTLADEASDLSLGTIR
ncbi:MAG: hypothetical protein EAX95_10825 [Candidatus Thorarchaeota archaeon]|nr:hypothetical protein [Candidatus Thorarchaeota archaeon]